MQEPLRNQQVESASASSVSDELAQVGPRLRAARRARGWTLEDLAERAGMSMSTLSRLESGKRQASLELLLPLTRQLGIRVDDLLAPGPADPRVVRATIRRDGMTLTPLAPEHAPLAIYRIVYEPVAEPPPLRTHAGYEWFYVVSGKLHLRLGEQEYVLGRGEAAEFDTQTPHAMWPAAGRPAHVLSIFNGDGERMHVRVEGG